MQSFKNSRIKESGGSMENHKNKMFIATLLSSFMLVSCNYRLFDLAQFPELQGKLPNISLENKITEQSFASVFQTIIEPKCLGCHKVGGKAEDVLFGTYEELMKAKNDEGLSLIVPGKPDDSLFYTAMLATTKRRMPPKKSEIPPVTDDRLEVVKQWIANGAIERSETTNPPVLNPAPAPEPTPTPIQPAPAEPTPVVPTPQPDPELPTPTPQPTPEPISQG